MRPLVYRNIVLKFCIKFPFILLSNILSWVVFDLQDSGIKPQSILPCKLCTRFDSAFISLRLLGVLQVSSVSILTKLVRNMKKQFNSFEEKSGKRLCTSLLGITWQKQASRRGYLIFSFFSLRDISKWEFWNGVQTEVFNKSPTSSDI